MSSTQELSPNMTLCPWNIMDTVPLPFYQEVHSILSICFKNNSNQVVYCCLEITNWEHWNGRDDITYVPQLTEQNSSVVNPTSSSSLSASWWPVTPSSIRWSCPGLVLVTLLMAASTWSTPRLMLPVRQRPTRWQSWSIQITSKRVDINISYSDKLFQCRWNEWDLRREALKVCKLR